MIIVKQEDFETMLPFEVTCINNDVQTVMDYDYVIQFTEEEKDEAWAKVKEMKMEADQIPRYKEFFYIGLYT